MSIMTSREFNQDVARAKRDAKKEPVVVTDRGRPTHVLVSHEEFTRMKAAESIEPKRSIIDMLAMPEGFEDIEFELPERKDFPRQIDLD